MKRILIVLTGCCAFYLGASSQENRFELTKELPRQLKEISGLAKDGNSLWAITDGRKSELFKLDLSGNILQTIQLKNVKLNDVESVSADEHYVYVGDVGDNTGTRENRTIFRVVKSAIGKETTEANSESIQFTFEGEGKVKKKKSNNYDCEAMISFGDSLYLFTKRRDDLQTEVFVVPKKPGSYTARSMGVFKTKGLVTDAAVSPDGNEIALIGYDEGHTRPFLWFLSNFKGNNFFSGHARRYEFTNEKHLDWQLESISYKDNNNLFISCEKTNDVPNTFYVINRKELIQSHKGDSK